MTFTRLSFSIIFIFAVGLSPLRASGLHEAVTDAISILDTKQDSGHPIPPRVLQRAHAVGIIEVTKGAFGVGGAAGKG